MSGIIILFLKGTIKSDEQYSEEKVKVAENIHEKVEVSSEMLNLDNKNCLSNMNCINSKENNIISSMKVNAQKSRREIEDFSEIIGNLQEKVLKLEKALSEKESMEQKLSFQLNIERSKFIEEKKKLENELQAFGMSTSHYLLKILLYV